MLKNSIKKYYSVKEAADILGISRVAVFNRIKKGQLLAEKIGRNYIILRENISDYVSPDLSTKTKKEINTAVAKTIKDYGSVLQKLGKE